MVIPTCHFPLGGNAHLNGAIVFEQIEGDVSQGYQVLWGVILTDTRLVFAKGNVKHPV